MMNFVDFFLIRTSGLFLQGGQGNHVVNGGGQSKVLAHPLAQSAVLY